MRRKSLRDLRAGDLADRRALMRVDYNVPLTGSGEVGDDTRIRATLPSLRHLLDNRARPILLSHLGRPKGQVVPGLSLAPVAPVLRGLVDAPVEFVASTDSEEAVGASRRLPYGSILLLENTRFLPGETANDPDLAARLARLGDLFVNDAFGSTHRAHASVVGVTEHLSPAVAGLLVQTELEALQELQRARRRPFVVVLGGAKISDKIGLLETFLSTADAVLIGGAMANTFFAAAGHSMGRSLVEPEAIAAAARFLEQGEGALYLPTDVIAADPQAASAGRAVTVEPGAVPADLAVLDIGPATSATYDGLLREAGTVFWNGPMGLFERPGFDVGTNAIAASTAACTAAGGFTVIGGGDSASAIQRAGLAHAVSHVSTGGGASLEFLAAGTLPGIEALDPAGESA